MKSRIDLLREYIRKEMEEDGCSPEQTSTYMRLSTFFAYQKIRIEEALYAREVGGKRDGRTAAKFAELDKKRREAHNTALICLGGFERLGKVLGLDPVYTGKTLTPEQIEAHRSKDNEARKEMTDGFFAIINEIHDYRAPEEREADEEGDAFINSLQRDIYRFESLYEVEETIREDDGDVRFRKRKEDRGIE